MPEPSVEQLEQELDLLETLQEVTQELGQFTQWLNGLTGADAGAWLSDDATVKYELGQLKSLIGKLTSEFGDAFKAGYGPLGEAAGAGGKYVATLSSLNSLVQVIDKADEASGADQARCLADLLAAAQQLTGLLVAINPVLGVFFGLYVTALQSAAVGIAKIQDYVDDRNEAILIAGGEVPQAEVPPDTTAEEEAEEALQRQIDDTFDRWLDAVFARDEKERRKAETDRLAALDIGARSHPEAVAAATERGSQIGGLVGSGLPANRHTMEAISRWIDDVDGEIANANSIAQEAKAAGNEEVYEAAVEKAQTYTEAKYDVLGMLRPVFETARDVQPQSTKSASSGRRLITFGAGGVLAGMLLLGGVFWLNDDGTVSPVVAEDQLVAVDDGSTESEALDSDGAVTDDVDVSDDVVTDDVDVSDDVVTDDVAASDDAVTDDVAASDDAATDDVESSDDDAGTGVEATSWPYTGVSSELEAAHAGLGGTLFMFGPAASNDSVDCATGEPVGDPASDVSGIVGTATGDTASFLVTMPQSPLESSHQYSWAVVLTLVWPDGSTSVLIWEIHDNEQSVGDVDAEGNVDPAGAVIELRDNGVAFTIAASLEELPALAYADAFSTPIATDLKSCDTGFGATFPSPIAPPDATGTCTADATSACLGNGRFLVQVLDGGNPVPTTGPGFDDLERFEGPNGPAVAGVVNGCGFNGHLWFFASAPPQTDYTVVVTDTSNGEMRTYEHHVGMAAPAITDGEAFATCP